MSEFRVVDMGIVVQLSQFEDLGKGVPTIEIEW